MSDIFPPRRVVRAGLLPDELRRGGRFMTTKITLDDARRIARLADEFSAGHPLEEKYPPFSVRSRLFSSVLDCC